MNNSSNWEEQVRYCQSCGHPNLYVANVHDCEKCKYDLHSAPIEILPKANSPAPPQNEPAQKKSYGNAESNASPDVPAREPKTVLINVTAPAKTPEDLSKTRVEPRKSILFISAATKKTFRSESGDILGRDGTKNNEVFVDIDTVSRKHAQIFYNGVNWEIEDLGSSNGTFINDKELAPHRRYPLQTGDVVKLSSQCTLKALEE